MNGSNDVTKNKTPSEDTVCMVRQMGRGALDPLSIAEMLDTAVSVAKSLDTSLMTAISSKTTDTTA